MVTDARRDLVAQERSLFDVLKNDHETLITLLEELKEAPLEEKGGILAQLDAAFMGHGDSEEQFFYLRLRRFSDLMDLVHTALAEHDRVRGVLQMLSGEEPGSLRWGDAFIELEDALTKHVTKEESIIFPRALRLMPAEEMNLIREQIEEQQQKIPFPRRYREVMAPRPERH